MQNAQCIAVGADAVDIGKTIHPHPTLLVTVVDLAWGTALAASVSTAIYLIARKATF